MITTETLWFRSETAGFPTLVRVTKAGGSSMRETDAAVLRRLRRVALLGVGALCLAGAPAAHAAEFSVNSTADLPDAKAGDHLCITAAATCTLRAAVQEAN